MPVKQPSAFQVAVGCMGLELTGKVLAEDKNLRSLIIYIIFKAIRRDGIPVEQITGVRKKMS